MIETERLILRAHTREDFEDVAALWASEISVRYTLGRPSTREETWARLHRYAGHWALLGYGYWAWVLKAGGRYVGEGGFADFKREMTPAIEAPEHGWALAPWAHGQGYACEALSAQLRWAEAYFGRGDFQCIIAPANAPSLKLAAKLDYREEARTTYKDSPTILMRRAQR